MEDLKISTEKSLLNIEMIHKYLSEESYWAKTRSLEIVQNAITHSLCFGVYLNDSQIGFARVVTDYSIFAWIMDLFILEKHRGYGYSKQLMSSISEHPDLQTINRWGLNTVDAHGLYEQFGFQRVSKAEIYMEKLIKKSAI